jgi:heme-degrading monooxygenase HmoA
MYAAIRRVTLQPGTFDVAVQLDESGLLPIYSSAPGFVEFTLLQAGEDVGVSVAIFETQEQAEEANRRAAGWIKENMAPLATAPAETLAVGEVRLRKAR